MKMQKSLCAPNFINQLQKLAYIYCLRFSACEIIAFVLRNWVVRIRVSPMVSKVSSHRISLRHLQTDPINLPRDILGFFIFIWSFLNKSVAGSRSSGPLWTGWVMWWRMQPLLLSPNTPPSPSWLGWRQTKCRMMGALTTLSPYSPIRTRFVSCGSHQRQRGPRDWHLSED